MNQNRIITKIPESNQKRMKSSLKEGLKNQLVDSMVPIDLFTGDRKEDDRNGFIKEHFKGLTLEETQKVNSVLKAYLPKFIPYYVSANKLKAEGETQTQTQGADGKNDKDNPLAAALGFPNFNNDSSGGKDPEKMAIDRLKKLSLSQLEQLDRKNQGVSE
jgi:hypothetical protein